MATIETLIDRSGRPKGHFESFMEWLPSIIAQYMQSADESARRDEIREENKALAKDNQWLQQNVAFRSDLHNIFINKNKEFQALGDKYEELAGRADKITDLNQTDEYTRILGVEADNAMEEVSNDIKAFAGLVKDVDTRAQTINDRIDIMHGIGVALAKKVPTTTDGAVHPALWTRDNIANAVDQIVTNPEFRNGYAALKPIEGEANITNPQWLDDYILAIKNPGDPTLMAMNAQILQYHAQELDYKTKAAREIETSIVGDPIVQQAAMINANQESLESFGNSLLMLNDFAFMYSKDLTVGEAYYSKIQGTSVNDPMSYIYKNVTVDEDALKAATKIVIDAGLLPADKKATPEEVQELLKIKHQTDVSASSGLAMIVGPERYLFTMHNKVGSIAAYASTVSDAMTAVDQFMDGAPIKNDIYKAHLSTFATHLGYSVKADLNKDGSIDSRDLSMWLLSSDPRATKAVERIEGLIMQFAKNVLPLTGEESTAISDTPFVKIVNQMKQIEDRIMKLQMGSDPNSFQNLQDQGNIGDMFNSQNGFGETELASISECVSIGGSWITGLGCTEFQSEMGPQLADKAVNYPPTNMNPSNPSYVPKQN